MSDPVGSIGRQAAQQAATQYLIETGLATVSEVAALRGVTRQYIQKVAGAGAREQRQRHLRKLWKSVLNKFG